MDKILILKKLLIGDHNKWDVKTVQDEVHMFWAGHK